MSNDLATLLLKQLEELRKEVQVAQRSIDLHIQEDMAIHAKTGEFMENVKPWLEDLRTAKQVSGWVGKLFNTKIGMALLLALTALITSLITNK